MWKLGDAVNLETLLDKAYAKALNQSAEVTSSWELIERELSYVLPDEEVLKEKEKVLKNWEILEMLQSSLGIENPTYHKRTQKQMLSMLYKVVKQMLAPDYKELEILQKLKNHYFKAYRRITERIEAQQRLLDAYKHNGWPIPRKELWKMKLYRKARRHIWNRYEILKTRYMEKRKWISEQLEKIYNFLPVYLEVIREVERPADWKVINKALS